VSETGTHLRLKVSVLHTNKCCWFNLLNVRISDTPIWIANLFCILLLFALLLFEVVKVRIVINFIINFAVLTQKRL